MPLNSLRPGAPDTVPYMEHTLNKGLLDREMEGRMDRQMGDRWMDGWIKQAKMLLALSKELSPLTDSLTLYSRAPER